MTKSHASKPQDPQGGFLTKTQLYLDTGGVRTTIALHAGRSDEYLSFDRYDLDLDR